jgi:1-deoxyxylulose-5-phosphate synthase
MRYVALGGSGLQISRLCLGMMSFGNPASSDSKSWRGWHLDEEAAEPIVRRAAEGGVTFFDTADMYAEGASERVTGSLLRRIFSRREEYVLATKVYYPMGRAPNDRGLSRSHVLASIDASLTRLGTDYVDLYQIHRWDDRTPIEETMEALSDLVRSGKVRYIGASSMFAWQFAKAQHAAEVGGWTRFVSMQNHYNLLYREEEREMIPLCADQGVGILPYSPLARGLLTGTRTRGGEATTTRADGDPLAHTMYHEDDFDIVDSVRAVAAEHEVAPAQIALAWLLAKPGVSAPIVGATQPRHINDALAAVNLNLKEQDTAQLETLYRAHEILGHT